MNSGKRIIIIAGPNGAGKTTFAKEYLPQAANRQPFVNADHIASALVPGNPESVAIRAGKIMLETIDSLAANNESFTLETTLSGRGYAKRIKQWRMDGYIVQLDFLSLDSPENAIRRVAARVSDGGHSIPPDVVRRRFYAGLENFEKIYCKCVDIWRFFDNTARHPVLLRRGTNHETT